MTKFLRLRRVKILRATVPQPKSILSFLAFISFVCPVIGCGDNALEQSDSGNDTKPALSAQDRRYSFVRFVDVTNEAGIHFKQTNGASGEKYLPESYGSGAVFFDYNNDGELDLYVVNGADFPGFQSRVIPTNVLYRNNGDGTFTDVTKSSGVGDAGYGQGCSAADYDNDGDMDLYVSNFGANILYRNNGEYPA